MIDRLVLRAREKKRGGYNDVGTTYFCLIYHNEQLDTVKKGLLIKITGGFSKKQERGGFPTNNYKIVLLRSAVQNSFPRL